MNPRIGIVGLGNVGTNLCLRLHEVGLAPKLIIAQSNSDRKQLAAKVGATLFKPEDRLPIDLDVLIIATPDDSILELGKKYAKQEMTLVHCAGSLPRFDFHTKSGVLYPFQTFSLASPVDWKGVTIFIDAEHEPTRILLSQLGELLSGKVQQLEYEKRRTLHLAGVLGNNFINHLLRLASDHLEKSNIDFNVLEPLLRETIDKAFRIGPEAAQTGPARRGDQILISKHMEQLEGQKELKEFYELFTKSIQSRFES